MKNSPPTRVIWGVASSPGGKLAVGLTAQGEICRIAFLRGRKAVEIVAEWQAQWKQTEFKAGVVPGDYERKPVLLIGTKFQQAVWRAMTKIPVGRAKSYGEIAQLIGNPKASRAVGAACGANPVPYLVPCHRVVAGNGGLGGFSSGLDVKKKLLKVEGYL